MMAVGGLIGAAAPLFAGSALFGPMGVVAVSFIIGGAILVARLSNTSFEDWLAGSIFSKEEGFTNSEPSQTNSMFWEGSSHLEDPDEALYRLLGLLTGVSIQVEENPDYDPSAFHGDSSSMQARIQRANTRITVRSNLNGMVSQLDSADSIVECLLVRNEVITHGRSRIVRRRDQPHRSTPSLQHVSSHARVLYVGTPHSGSFRNADQYYWEVRAQFRLKDRQKNKTWVFPAPDPKVMPINTVKETDPDFVKIDRPFWADQETHAVTGAAG